MLEQMLCCAAFHHRTHKTQLYLYRMQTAHITIVLSNEKFQAHLNTSPQIAINPSCQDRYYCFNFYEKIFKYQIPKYVRTFSQCYLLFKILNNLCSALLYENKVNTVVCTIRIVGLDTEPRITNVYLHLIFNKYSISSPIPYFI